jgi:hypothetical protein
MSGRSTSCRAGPRCEGAGRGRPAFGAAWQPNAAPLRLYAPSPGLVSPPTHTQDGGGGDDAVPCHVVRVVDSRDLATCRAEMEPVTCMHVHRCAPPPSPASPWPLAGSCACGDRTPRRAVGRASSARLLALGCPLLQTPSSCPIPPSVMPNQPIDLSFVANEDYLQVSPADRGPTLGRITAIE